MKAIINMTTAFLLLLMFLFGWSLVTYNENPEKYQWLDANGEFKTSSYDITVSYNLDTPQDDLNGYSLKEVFETYQLIDVNNIHVAENAIYTVYDNYQQLTSTGQGTYFSVIWLHDPIDTANYYYNIDLETSVNLNAYFNIRGSSMVSDVLYMIANTRKFQSKILSPNSNPHGYIRLLSYTLNSTIKIYDVNVVNLTALGINLTSDEMDFWYSEYQKLQDNQIENYKELGSTVESSWQFLTGYFTTLVDILDAQVQVILNPFEALADGLSIITVPIFG